MARAKTRRSADYYVDKHGDIQLTRKRIAELRKVAEETVKEKREAVARRKDAYLLSVWATGQRVMDLIVSVREAERDFSELFDKRDYALYANQIDVAILSSLPRETQRELSKILRARLGARPNKRASGKN